MDVGGQRHAQAALPSGRRHGTLCIGGWVGPRAGLYGCAKFRPPPPRFFSLMHPYLIGFGGLGVACWPLVPKFAGSNPAEAVGVLGRKNPQHAFLRRGSKAVGPMS